MRTNRALILLTLAGALATLSCEARDTLLEPDGSPALPPDAQTTVSVTCTADLEAARVTCDDGTVGSNAVEGMSNVLLGGQGTYVRLYSANTCFECSETNIFETDVSFQNLLPQRMSYADGSVWTADIFFHSPPNNGVLVDNFDGIGFFTGSSPQPFFRYFPGTHFNVENTNTWLDPDETSGTKHWRFDTSAISGTQFTFQVALSVVLEHPDGWVEITPDTTGVPLGGTKQLSAAAYDFAGNPVSGRTFAWTSRRTDVTTVDATGLLTGGTQNRRTWVIAASDGPEDPDSASVVGYVDLSARTPVTSVSDTAGGRQFFGFTVSSPSASVTDGRFASHVSTLLALAVDSTVGSTYGSPGSGGGPQLYVRRDTPPDIDFPVFDYDCRSIFVGLDDSCEFEDPVDGTYIAMLYADTDYSGAQVIADIGNSDPGFDIEVVFKSAFTNGEQTAILNAAAHWATVITGDLKVTSLMNTACFGEASGYEVNRISDDLVIYADKAAIDGTGNVLAKGGTCAIRGSLAQGGIQEEDEPLPGSAALSFDEADLPGMTAAEIESVALHEMGHALGMPGLWNPLALLSGSGSGDPRYIGAGGELGYENVGGPANTSVPVQVGAEAHWRECEFDNELMTPFSDPDERLSEVTARQMADLGYTITLDTWDAYVLADGCGTAALRAPGAAVSGGDDLLLNPVFYRDAEGRVRTLQLLEPR